MSVVDWNRDGIRRWFQRQQLYVFVAVAVAVFAVYSPASANTRLDDLGVLPVHRQCEVPGHELFGAVL